MRVLISSAMRSARLTVPTPPRAFARSTGSARKEPRYLCTCASSSTEGAVSDAEPTAEDLQAAQEQNSQAVEERMGFVGSEEELETALFDAGERLVVLEVMQEDVCETGLLEADDGWSPDQHEAHLRRLDKCTDIKHSFTRMAADSPDVQFLNLTVNADEASRDLGDKLGVTRYPTVIFFMNQEIVWESWGPNHLEDDTLEGMLYFGDSPAIGLRASENVRELHTSEEFDAFVAADAPGPSLKCVMLCAPFCNPCVHVYPSMVMLAKNFTDKINFARLSDDESENVAALFQRLNLLEVPTFVIYQDGREVSRNVSGNRGDLVGHLLDAAFKYGVSVSSPISPA